MHIEKIGQGVNVVMLHGWSMHSGVWNELASQLSKWFCVHLVDLPGHGKSQWQASDFAWQHVIEDLHCKLPEQAIWVGWSLGGLISLAVAEKFPDFVKKLVLLAATPKFTQGNDWSCAMNNHVFQSFADNLSKSPEQTIKNFLLLQARGAQDSRLTIKNLIDALSKALMPHPQALKIGLQHLLDQDKREALKQINCPVMVMLGEKDALIPITVAAQLKKINPAIRIEVLSQLGHAPFIAKPQDCAQLIEAFINE